MLGSIKAYIPLLMATYDKYEYNIIVELLGIELFLVLD